MNPHLVKLNPYPFERLRKLFAGVTPPPGKKTIVLSIGEPKHPTPPLIQQALIAGLSRLANYPTTPGMLPLREAISAWLSRRHSRMSDSVNPGENFIRIALVDNLDECAEAVDRIVNLSRSL